MKNTYFAPKMELISFDAKDIITTSGPTGNSFTGYEDSFGWSPAGDGDLN